jgi:hypothetical protein
MIEKRPFGRTGYMSTVTLFGAAALSRVNQDDADRTLEVLEYGVNHIDPAARSGDFDTVAARRSEQGWQMIFCLQ